MKISEVIKILVSDDGSSFPFEKEFAVIRFCGWINWPNDSGASDSLAILLMLHVLSNRREELSPEAARQLLLQLNPASILSSFEEQGLIAPPEVYDIDPNSKSLKNNEYVADIVRFLLTFGSAKSKDNALKPSLGKAYEFINKKKGFPGDSRLKSRSPGYAESNHQRIWKQFKPTAAFQFVRYYDSKIDWIIDAHDKHVLDRVAQLSQERDAIKEFFAKCLWTQSILKTTLDKRSMELSDYIVFPETLVPLPCKLPPKPAKFIDRMKGYERNRGAMYFEE